MPVYRVDAVNIPQLYRALQDVGRACPDDDAPIDERNAYLPAEITACDLAQGKAFLDRLTLPITDSETGQPIIARDPALFQAVYRRLRWADADDDQLDGQIARADPLTLALGEARDLATKRRDNVESVVYIHSAGDTEWGTGFLVARERMLGIGAQGYRYVVWTAGHVINKGCGNGKGCWVKPYGFSGSVAAELVGIDAEADLGILTFATAQWLPVARLGDSDAVRPATARLRSVIKDGWLSWGRCRMSPRRRGCFALTISTGRDTADPRC